MTITALFDPSMKDAVGVITYWNCGGGATVESITASLAKRGLQGLAPEPISKSQRLWRATTASAPKGHIYRDHPKGGIAIVREDKIGTNLLYTEVARAHLSDEDPGVAVEVFDPTGIGMIPAILQTQWDFYKGRMISTDVASWLCGTAMKFHAVSLRRSGGFYFIPKDEVEGWRKVRESAMEQPGDTVIHEIPAMATSDAISAIVEALVREAQTEVGNIRNDLTRDLGRRALTSRKERLMDARIKLRAYVDQIGANLDDMLEAVDALEVTIAQSIAAMDDKEDD